MLIDPRIRLLILIILSVAHAVASARVISLLLVSTLTITILYRQIWVRGAKVIVITLIALGIFSLLILLTSINVSSSEIINNYLRWSSLVIVSVILFLSINALEITTGLVYFHIPLGIAMAVGVGFRFLPVFFEEAKRIRIIRRHREGGMFWSTLRTCGFVNTLSRAISPLIVSVLRRIDMLLLSIAVQQLEQRISSHRFSTLKTRDWMALLAAIIILTASLFL